VAILAVALASPRALAVELTRSVRSGPWSAASTWEAGRAPPEGSRVHIRSGHRVIYDLESKEPMRSIHISGTLTFARDRSTRLEVGLIRIDREPPGETDEGFECAHETPSSEPPHAGSERPALEIGTREQPIPREHRALVRLVFFEGMNEESLPAIVCCGGRMDLHGAPLRRTWVKLA